MTTGDCKANNFQKILQIPPCEQWNADLNMAAKSLYSWNGAYGGMPNMTKPEAQAEDTTMWSSQKYFDGL